MISRAGLLALVLACTTEARPTEPRDPRDPDMHTVVLTASAPRQELAIPAFSAATPTTLTIVVTAIDNPSSQAFSVGAGLTWTGGTPPALDEDIGSVTPFPASEPGRFVLALPEAARALATRSDGASSLRLGLEPITADRPLVEPLRVTIGDVIWR